jgi:5-methylcytosine-specific restriction endonuclease McrA
MGTFVSMVRTMVIDSWMHGLSSAARGYGSRWQRARIGYLQSHPLCKRCRESNRISAAEVVDHIKPPKLGEALQSGDVERIRQARDLFWNRNNWQGLCGTCHNAGKQSEERTGRRRGCDADGIPVDPGHHWR